MALALPLLRNAGSLPAPCQGPPRLRRLRPHAEMLGYEAGFGDASATVCSRGLCAATAAAVASTTVARPAAARRTVEAPTMSVRDIYNLLCSAPSLKTTLRLAARLRKAAKDQRPLKDGRVLSVDNVDEALDLVLSQRMPGRQEDEDVEEESPQKPRKLRLLRRSRPEAQQESAETGDDGASREPLPQAETASTSGFFDPFAEPYQADFEEDAKVAREARRLRRLSQAQSSRGPSVAGTIAEASPAIILPKNNDVQRVWSASSASSLPVPALEDGTATAQESWLRLPHVVINGMTNAGKSSMINHLLKWGYACRVSSAAGKTADINFLCVNSQFILVDLPGYPDDVEVSHLGVRNQWEVQWQDLIFRYLELAESGAYDVRLFCHLQQSPKWPASKDRRMAQLTAELGLPSLLVLTKDDLLEPEMRNKRAEQIKDNLGWRSVPHIHYTTKSELEFSRRAKRILQKWIRRAISAESRTDVAQLLQDTQAAQRARKEPA
mmetsp:Transcript_55537/g.124927  ORF Transcript_55537/g.124927 Transcript_55537/m.124927 type:complete len:496 (+) Transcript_55537:49-1536(+)